VSNQLRLEIAGNKFEGWLRIRVVRSIERPTGTFSLSITERWESAKDAPPQIIAGDECKVFINDDLVLAGHVDDILPSYDAKTHTIKITGRSKAADLVDCGQRAREWKERSLGQIAMDLARPYGINVRDDANVGKSFASQAIEPGQTAYEFLEKLARQRAVRFISDADGTLVITRAGTKRISTPLQLGINIMSAGGRFSVRDRFHKYTVIGQRPGTDWNNTDAAADQQASEIDADVREVREQVILAENAVDIDDCKRRAKWKRNTAYGKGHGLTYTVRGWRHAGGLWEPNTLVPIIDPWMRLDNEFLLITGVQYLLDKEGERTEIQVMPAEAFDLLPLPPKKEAVKWS